MGEEEYIGRREIVDLFKDLRLISKKLNYIDGWLTILRWRRKYNLYRLFHRSPNGKPIAFKTEIVAWIKEHDRLAGEEVQKKLNNKMHKA